MFTCAMDGGRQALPPKLRRQCVAVCGSVLQCNMSQYGVAVWCGVVRCVAVCCIVVQCVAAYLERQALHPKEIGTCSALQYAPVRCSPKEIGMQSLPALACALHVMQ